MMRLDAHTGNKRLLYLGLVLLFIAIPFLILGFHFFIQPFTQLPLDGAESQGFSLLSLVLILAGGICMIIGLFCAHLSIPPEEQDTPSE
jgi:hypothetical protein